MLNKIKYFAIASIVFSGIVYALLVPAPVLAASPPVGCPGGGIGPPAPGVSCQYTGSQVYEYCSNPSSLPPGSSVFCSTNGGGVVEVSQSSQPVVTLPPVGCPGGAIGPPAPGVSCQYTGSQVEQYCSNPSSLPPESSVFCDANGGGLVKINQSSQPVGTGSTFEADCVGADADKTNCRIIYYLLAGINVLSASVGVIVVIMIAVGGMQYSAARDNPQAVAAARGRIINALMGLLAYLFIYAFLQYLVPGGVL